MNVGCRVSGLEEELILSLSLSLVSLSLSLSFSISACLRPAGQDRNPKPFWASPRRLPKRGDPNMGVSQNQGYRFGGSLVYGLIFWDLYWVPLFWESTV